MYYDILMVPYEYEQVEKYFNEKNYEKALSHYKSMQLHYENADNIYYFGPDTPITITEMGLTKNYPSINEMLRKAGKMVWKLRKYKIMN